MRGTRHTTGLVLGTLLLLGGCGSVLPVPIDAPWRAYAYTQGAGQPLIDTPGEWHQVLQRAAVEAEQALSGRGLPPFVRLEAGGASLLPEGFLAELRDQLQAQGVGTSLSNSMTYDIGGYAGDKGFGGMRVDGGVYRITTARLLDEEGKPLPMALLEMELLSAGEPITRPLVVRIALDTQPLRVTPPVVEDMVVEEEIIVVDEGPVGQGVMAPSPVPATRPPLRLTTDPAQHGMTPPPPPSRWP